MVTPSGSWPRFNVGRDTFGNPITRISDIEPLTVNGISLDHLILVGTPDSMMLSGANLGTIPLDNLLDSARWASPQVSLTGSVDRYTAPMNPFVIECANLTTLLPKDSEFLLPQTARLVIADGPWFDNPPVETDRYEELTTKVDDLKTTLDRTTEDLAQERKQRVQAERHAKAAQTEASQANERLRRLEEEFCWQQYTMSSLCRYVGRLDGEFTLVREGWEGNDAPGSLDDEA